MKRKQKDNLDKIIDLFEGLTKRIGPDFCLMCNERLLSPEEILEEMKNETTMGIQILRKIVRTTLQIMVLGGQRGISAKDITILSIQGPIVVINNEYQITIDMNEAPTATSKSEGDRLIMIIEEWANTIAPHEFIMSSGMRKFDALDIVAQAKEGTEFGISFLDILIGIARQMIMITIVTIHTPPSD